MVVRAAGDYAASVELASDASQADSGDADWACTIDVLALDGDEDEWIDVDFSILSPRAAERDAVLGPDPLFAGRWPDRGVAVR